MRYLPAAVLIAVSAAASLRLAAAMAFALAGLYVLKQLSRDQSDDEPS